MPVESKDGVWWCVCAKCGHRWMSREVEAPRRCAKCKTPGWKSGEDRRKVGRLEAVPPVRRVERRVVADVVARAVSAGRSDHNPHGCRVYRCGLCVAAGYHDPRRGI